MPRIAPWLLALLLSGAAAAPTQADEGRERSARVPVPRNNGPRWVPTPRGASARRAEALGLGTRAAANRLMHGHPDPRWVAAAAQAGPMPAHLRWPVELGRFGRGFGFVRRTRPELRHDGVDIVAAEGSTLRAVAPGLVAYADNGVRGFGNAVMIVHPNGWVSVYAHCHRVTVPAGYRVRAGERIGFVGSTGISRGPHLHLELRTDGRAFDPLPSFEGRPWIAAYRAWRARRAAGEAEVSGQHLEDRLPPQRPAPAPATPAPAAALGRIG
ncbi:MAG: M23 family metallopeptidase, partial [Myxococcota bacterium]